MDCDMEDEAEPTIDEDAEMCTDTLDGEDWVLHWEPLPADDDL
jgi:hypothetical protein